MEDGAAVVEGDTPPEDRHRALPPWAPNGRQQIQATTQTACRTQSLGRGHQERAESTGALTVPSRRPLLLVGGGGDGVAGLPLPLPLEVDVGGASLGVEELQGAQGAGQRAQRA